MPEVVLRVVLLEVHRRLAVVTVDGKRRSSALCKRSGWVVAVANGILVRVAVVAHKLAGVLQTVMVPQNHADIRRKPDEEDEDYQNAGKYKGNVTLFPSRVCARCFAHGNLSLYSL